MHGQSITHEQGINAITLRPYQQAAIAKVYSARDAGKKAALCVLPTGTGKTEVFSKIIHDLQVPTLVLAHRNELLQQAKEKLLRYYDEEDIELVEGKRVQWDKPIIVASVQTARNRLEQLRARGIRLAVIDEAHHTTKKNSYNRVLDAMPDAFIMGFTATPKRLDGSDITAIYGDPVYERDIISMVTEGWLCDLKGIAVRSSSSLDNVTKHLGDYSEQELAQALNVTHRNALVVHAYLKHADGLSTICFAINVEHAHELARAFNDAGVPSMAIDGKTPLEERKWILEQFTQGAIKVLVNCEILTEGFDAPFVECIIMARPTLSYGLFMQMLGRGTRLYTDEKTGKEKERCLILDITDNCTRHKLTPQTFKRVMGINAPGQDISILEYLEAERICKERAQREAEEIERVQREAMKRAQELAQERKARALQERHNVVFTEIPLLGNGVPWVHLPDGKITVKVAYATITITPTPEYTYNVIATDKFTSKTLGYSLSLAQAKERAEKYAGEIEAKIAARKHDLPTPKQIETLHKFRIAIPAGCTFGQASQLISARIAQLQSSKGA